ncbi:MAG: hypothetical protein JOS17DRAFT_538948 [Linnemannia elongata]|nr:MAG: hypothetical protein JOS17DRAFT_538948 [Linnemannia elongata]
MAIVSLPMVLALDLFVVVLRYCPCGLARGTQQDKVVTRQRFFVLSSHTVCQHTPTGRVGPSRTSQLVNLFSFLPILTTHVHLAGPSVRPDQC